MATKKTTLEKSVADTILQRASDSVTIGGVTYPIAPPTPATIILVSELVAEMPQVRRVATVKEVPAEVLSTAKDMQIVGRIAATPVLGAKRIKEERRVQTTREREYTRREWSWRKLRFTKQQAAHTYYGYVPELDYLSEQLLQQVSPEELLRIVSGRLAMMQVGSFFELTAFLSEANHLRRTREAVTPSGDLS